MLFLFCFNFESTKFFKDEYSKQEKCHFSYFYVTYFLETKTRLKELGLLALCALFDVFAKRFVQE